MDPDADGTTGAERVAGDAAARVELAEAHGAAGRPLEAAEEYRAAIALDPRRVDARVGLALALRAAGDGEGSIRAHLDALANGADPADARGSLGDVLHSMGRFEEAVACYSRAIETRPGRARLHRARARARGALGQTWLAVHDLETATRVEPDSAEGHRELADALREIGATDRAVSSYARALAVAPDDPVALEGLACAHADRGDGRLAERIHRRAIEVRPDYADAHCNLANALSNRGDLEGAERHYLAALSIRPDHADSLNNLANVKRGLGRLDEADGLYAKAIESRPDFVAAHINRASLLRSRGDLEGALRHYRSACERDPSADALRGMADVSVLRGDLAGAAECRTRAAAVDPRSPEAQADVAAMHEEAGDFVRAVRFYRVALALRPDFDDAFCRFAHCLQAVCEWSDYERRIERLHAAVDEALRADRVPAIHPHRAILYRLSGPKRLEIASRVSALRSETPSAVAVDRPPSSGRIRVAYASADFGDHPTSHLMRSVPGAHDRSRFEVICLALSADDGSAFRSTLVAESERFVDLSALDDAAAVASVRELGVDVLVDLNGHTKGARAALLAARPAPVAAVWLGYPDTTGSPFVDYFITDRIATPPTMADGFAEKFAYLGRSYFVGDHRRMFPHLKERYVEEETGAVLNAADTEELEGLVVARSSRGRSTVKFATEEPFRVVTSENAVEWEVGGMRIANGLAVSSGDRRVGLGERPPDTTVLTTRSHYGLPGEAVVYCNFNQLYKLDPNGFRAWMTVLKRVPNSVLWLLRFPAAGEANLRREAASAELPDSRIVFSDVAAKEEHVRRGQLADVFLDTPLCNGHTTCLDALWSCTPVVTLPGDTAASRAAASQLETLGCPELIATSLDDYVELAVKLGTDPDYLDFVREKVTGGRNRSPLFDPADVAQGLESLYSKMVERYEKAEELDHI